MSNDISFILPHRSRDLERQPHRKQTVVLAIDSLNEMMVGQPYNYDIQVVSKDEIKGDHVVWQEEPAGNNGAVLGFNMGYWNSKSKYVLTLIDDCVYNNTFLKGIPFLESDAFKDRRFKVTSLSPELGYNFLNTAMPILDSTRRLHPGHGFSSTITLGNTPNRDEVFGPAFPVQLPVELCNPKYLEDQHRYPVFGYVCADRECVKKEMNDHLANPRFRHRYWDNWISFFIGESGEFPLVCDGTYSTISNKEYSSFHNNDLFDLNIFFELAVDICNGKNLEYAKTA